MFIADRDLLVIEPAVFRDAGWLAQRLASGPASVSSSVLTCSAGNFVNVNVTTGHVVMVDATPLEVMSRLSATTLAVSLLRAGAAESAIPVKNVAAGNAAVWTLRPQIAAAHGQIVRMLGLDVAAALAAPGQVVDDSRITNPEGLQRLEALMTLHAVYSALAALRGRDDPFANRAEAYRDAVRAERQRAVALIDTDFDGVPNVARRVNTFVMSR
ncbi:hypothetical protein BH11PLA1_BH11PLA1_22040 [soil metagenome]